MFGSVDSEVGSLLSWYASLRRRRLADVDVDPPEGQLAYIARSITRDKLALLGAGILMAIIGLSILAPSIAHRSPTAISPSMRLASPRASGYPLGGDQVGRCILSRILWGGRLTLRATFQPLAVSVAIGTFIGLISGYFGGWLDNLIMRVLDVIFALPSILVAIAIVAALGPGIENAVLAVTVVSVPIFARFVRASVLMVKEQDFISAARVAGASPWQIMYQEILPNIIPSVIVYATLDAGRIVILSSGLSFLGLGVQPPMPDWGAMLAEGRHLIAVAPHVATIPGLMIFLLTLGLNLLGDGLRDALDPRLRGLRD